MADAPSLKYIRTLLQPDERLIETVTSDTSKWDGKIFSAHELMVALPDGSTGRREIVRHNGGAGVCAVRDGKICLVRQYRVALKRMTLEIPAGKIDPGEDPATCAAREFSEETGLIAQKLSPLAVSAGSPGFTNERTRIFYASEFLAGTPHLDEGEFVDVVWISLDAMSAAIHEGLIQDAKTIISVFGALTHTNQA